MMAQGIQYAWLKVMPITFFLALLLLAFFAYATRNNERWAQFRRVCSFKRLALAAVIVRVAYAAVLTVLQYNVWASGGLGTLFLHESLNKSLPIPLIQKMQWLFNSQWGYFIFYTFERFWLNAILSIGVAWLFYRFLILLKRYEERFFEVGEVELGFFAALLAGWPAFVIFLPLVFVFVVVWGLVRITIFKESYTTLGWPFFAAILITLFFGRMLISLLGLSVLNV